MKPLFNNLEFNPKDKGLNTPNSNKSLPDPLLTRSGQPDKFTTNTKHNSPGTNASTLQKITVIELNTKPALDKSTDTLARCLPLIFEKKQDLSPIKKLKYIKSDTGRTRHYSPAALEWYNSVYAFNKNYAKSLPALDKTLASLLKSYCNMWPLDYKFKKSPKLVNNHIKKKKLRGKKKYWAKRANNKRPKSVYKRASLKKVFVGKGDLKHTSTNVIVTLYTYNIAKLFLLKIIKHLVFNFFLTEIPYINMKTHIINKNIDNDKNNVVMVKMLKKKKDRKGRNYPSKFIPMPKNKVDLKLPVFLYNRRLTLDEYLSTSIDFYRKKNNKQVYVKNPYMPIDKTTVKYIWFPVDLAEKGEIRLNNKKYKKNKPLRVPSYYYNLLSYTLKSVNRISTQLKIINIYYNFLTKLVQNKILNDNEKLLFFISKANKFNVYKFPCNTRFFMTKFKQKKLYLAGLITFSWFLYVNDMKFKHPVIVSKLKYLVKNLYNKKVEFNIVDLKKLHLNIDIYTQLVALKLKNRKNKLYRVLKRSLNKINLPNVSRLSEKHYEFKWETYLANKLRNRYIKSMLKVKALKVSNSYIKSMFKVKSVKSLEGVNMITNELLLSVTKWVKILPKKDQLDSLLLDLIPSIYKLNRPRRVRHTWVRPFFKGIVVNTIKHNKLAGIRVEAKGRLTRRLTAQRSVFKMQYKGGLRNVDSSLKGIPAVMLRGFVRSNVQYTIIHGKNRVGAYGVKGWIGSKDRTFVY